MHHFLPTIIHFVTNHPLVAYGALFLGVVIEGEFVLLITGILMHLDIFAFWPALIFAFLGAVGKTVIYYLIGMRIHKKYPESTFFSFFEARVTKFLPRFKDRPFWSIFATKFIYIYGINHFTLLYCGYFKVKFKTYFKAELLSSIIWVLGFLSIGLFFSYTAIAITKDLRKVVVIILLLLLGFILLQKFIAFIYETRAEFKKIK